MCEMWEWEKNQIAKIWKWIYWEWNKRESGIDNKWWKLVGIKGKNLWINKSTSSLLFRISFISYPFISTSPSNIDTPFPTSSITHSTPSIPTTHSTHSISTTPSTTSFTSLHTFIFLPFLPFSFSTTPSTISFPTSFLPFLSFSSFLPFSSFIFLPFLSFFSSIISPLFFFTSQLFSIFAFVCLSFYSKKDFQFYYPPHKTYIIIFSLWLFLLLHLQRESWNKFSFLIISLISHYLTHFSLSYYSYGLFTVFLLLYLWNYRG